MKFGRHLRRSQYPPWLEHYVDYSGHKKWIKVAYESSSAFESQKAFFARLVAEMRAIDVFYLAQLDRITVALEEAKATADLYPEETYVDVPYDLAFTMAGAIQNLINELELLGRFSVLNVTALRKIAKKCDKRLNTCVKDLVRHRVLVHALFCRPQRIVHLVEQARDLYDFFAAPILPTAGPTSRTYIGTYYRPTSYRVMMSLLPQSLRYVGGMPMTTRRMAYFLLVIFLLQVVALQFFGEEIQHTGCSMSMTLQRATSDNAALLHASEVIHNRITSQAWLLLCAVVYWTFDADVGASLFTFVATSFVTKSLAKAFIQSPRVFWLCNTYRAFHCGNGFSLPSGHAMVSLSVLSYLLVKYRKRWIWGALLFYEAVVLINVIFIGTHTLADVIVGWTCGLLFLCAWIWAEVCIWRSCSYASSRWIIGFVICIAALTAACDTLEVRLSSATVFPSHYATNMAAVCGYSYEKATQCMTLPLRYTNTTLVVGCMVAFLLRRGKGGWRGVDKFGRGTGHGIISRRANRDTVYNEELQHSLSAGEWQPALATPLPVHVPRWVSAGTAALRLFLGGYVLVSAPRWTRNALIDGPLEEYWRHIHGFIFPILTLVVVPLVCELLTFFIMLWKTCSHVIPFPFSSYRPSALSLNNSCGNIISSADKDKKKK